MSTVALAAAIMTGLGLSFAIVLAVAFKFLHVPEDPRIAHVEELLPGSNCGACGKPGCRAFAEQVVAGAALPGLCTVTGVEGVQAIADYLGVDAGSTEKRVARLHCAGGAAHARGIAAYEGLRSCAAAALVGAGGKACSWGCLGLADCQVACSFDAIHMNDEGLPVVDIHKCTACGDCVRACPRDLFVIEPFSLKLVVQCRVPLKGDQATALCSVACDGCARCELDAAPGLIHMENNLPVVAPHREGDAGPKATYRCPTGAIQWVEGRQFEAEDAVERPSRRPHALFG